MCASSAEEFANNKARATRIAHACQQQRKDNKVIAFSKMWGDETGRRPRSAAGMASNNFVSDQIELLPGNGPTSFDIETVVDPRKGK